MRAFACFFAQSASAQNGLVGLPFDLTMLMSKKSDHGGGGARKYWVIIRTRGFLSAIVNARGRYLARLSSDFLYLPLAMKPYSVRKRLSGFPFGVVSFFCLASLSSSSVRLRSPLIDALS